MLTGALATATRDGTVAIALLPLAQTLTGKLERVTQVLVKPAPGADALVARELRRLAAGRLDVEPVQEELRQLGSAEKPTNQSTSLFAAIGGMVGFLLALNAMLLTVPERRRFIADLRMQGFDSRQVLLILGFQALLLGVGASIVGVVLGDVLSHTLFHRVPLYLAVAFPLSSAQLIHLSTVLLAIGAGVLATLIASAPPLIDLHPGRPADAVFREIRDEAGIAKAAVLWLASIGLAVLLALTVLVLSVPRLTVLGGVALAVVAICLVPAVFVTVVGALARIGERIPGSMLVIAVTELRSTATRSIALACVAALAVYGSVAIGGARADLLNGIDGAISHYFSTADIWVVNGDDIFNTNGFTAGGTAARIARVPGVMAVRTYQGGLLDVGVRRLWVRARAPDDPAMLEAGQLVSGNLAHATELLRRGGWAAISSELARERHLRVGGSISLPTPSGSVRFGVAAIMTNSGWPPGAITINTNDYSRYWRTTNPSALEVDIRGGVAAGGGETRDRRCAARSPGIAGAHERPTHRRKRGQRASGAANARGDSDAAADRGGVVGRVGARRGHLAAARQACVAAHPGLRLSPAVAGAVAGEPDPAEHRLPRRRAAGHLRPRAGEPLAGAHDGLLRSVLTRGIADSGDISAGCRDGDCGDRRARAEGGQGAGQHGPTGVGSSQADRFAPKNLLAPGLGESSRGVDECFA